MRERGPRGGLLARSTTWSSFRRPSAIHGIGPQPRPRSFSGLRKSCSTVLAASGGLAEFELPQKLQWATLKRLGPDHLRDIGCSIHKDD
jgi:hypothetical protein